MKSDALAWTVIAMVTAATSAAATVLTVPSDYPTIAAALNVAAPGDEVRLDAGTYLEADLILPSGVTLRGATGDPTEVVIDAARQGRCLYGTDLAAATRIADLTLRNGLSTAGTTPHRSWGGGLYVEGGEPAIENCIFAANEAAIGGGAFIDGTGTPRLDRCVFDTNTATEGAGLFLTGICAPEIRDCSVSGGHLCVYGAGISWAGSGTALLERCTVTGNTAIESAGGFECVTSGAWAVLRDCEIGGNSAPVGPDGFVASGAEVILHCCRIDLESWAVFGTVTVDDDCGVPVRQRTWGGVKSLYR